MNGRRDLMAVQPDFLSKPECRAVEEQQRTPADTPCLNADIHSNLNLYSKNAALTEKYILELLSLPEAVQTSLQKQCQSSKGAFLAEGLGDISVQTGDLKMMGEDDAPPSGELPVSFPEFEIALSSDSRRKGDFVGISNTAANIMYRTKDPNVIESLACPRQDQVLDASSEKLHAGSTAIEIRSRKRREFHKIHTRRSRAKLNEKMETLRKMLPAPPAGTVVKSKAQIIDYAIKVLSVRNQLDDTSPGIL